MRAQSSYLLMADDDEDDRLVFGLEFQQVSGIRVQFAGGGLELLGYLQDCPTESLPAVALIDYKMYDLNGPEILQKLASDRRYDGVLKVVWSTSQMSREMYACLRLGAAAYLTKPATNIELSGVIRKLTAFFEEPVKVQC